MARLYEGERARRERQVHRLLRRHCFGLRESEIAATLGWDRRTVNNYLRTLRRQRLIYKEGRDWFAEG